MITDDKIIRLIFGFKVRHLRQQREMSYQELSGLTGLSTSYLNDIEKGKRYPKPDKINVIADALKVDYNYMVATNASKKLQPIIDLLTSKVFKHFPLEEFGISLEKLLELFTQTPDKVNAFISTIFKIARNYQVSEKIFFMEALRSYQDMNNNYFGDLELATEKFKNEYSIKGTLPFTVGFLEDQLDELYDIKVDRVTLSKMTKDEKIRSYFNKDLKILYIRKNLDESQENFLLARELGFQFLGIEDRPYEMTVLQIESFDQLLNNYKASHFAAALLMDEENLVKDIRHLARENTWDPKLFSDLLVKYNVTPEMLLQRMTNIIPHNLKLEDLFFIRLSGDKSSTKFKMTKDLHLSRLQSPYNNELNEHYCNRWVSITSIKELSETKKKKEDIIIDAQISKYWNTNKEYLCISIAKPGFKNDEVGVSVTIGLLVTPELRSLFHFISDPALKYREVHTTCERCGVVDCESRMAPPTIIEERKERRALLEALQDLGTK